MRSSQNGVEATEGIGRVPDGATSGEDEMDPLSMQLASTNIGIYSHVVRHSTEALECRALEDILLLATTTFEWIKRAYEGLCETPESERSPEWDDRYRRVIVFYRMWLEPCERARNLTAIQRGRGFSPRHAADLEKCEAEARRIIDSQSWTEAEGLNLDATEAALRAAADAQKVDLAELLDRASRHFDAPFALPRTSLLQDEEVSGLVEDDRRAIGW